MNRIVLTFKDKNIEKQYQDEKLKIITKPICYLLLLASFALNFVKVLLDFTFYQKPNNSWMNVSLLLLVLIETFIVRHRCQFIKYALFISNITVGLLQINFDESNTLPQEYYYYGSNISMFSTAVYLISDFQFGVLEIIIHLGMKIFFTTYKSGRVDITGIMLGFTTSGFMILTLYICDWNARRQFLFNLREINWEESLPTIIRKPFYLFSYEDKRLSFQVKKQFKHEKFPYYNEEECFGCNFRHFLRKCKFYKNNLEIFLFENKNDDVINKKIQYRNKFQQFDIRICCVGLDQNLFLLILEKIENYSQNFIPKDTNIRQKLFCSLKKQLKFPHQKHYLLGVFTMFLYSNTEISKINLVELLEKFSHNYQIYSNKLFHIIYTQKSSYELTTYKNQLVIFLIQLFDCILNSCQNNQYDSKFILHQELHVIKVKLIIQDQFQFQEFYNENFFIQKIQKNILQEELDERKILSFIKKIQNNK